MALTPANVERTNGRETVRNNIENIPSSLIRCKRDQKGLQRGSSDAKKDQDIDDKKFVVSGHDEVVQSGKCGDGVCFLGNE